jgi:hypothetical protein
VLAQDAISSKESKEKTVIKAFGRDWYASDIVEIDNSLQAVTAYRKENQIRDTGVMEWVADKDNIAKAITTKHPENNALHLFSTTLQSFIGKTEDFTRHSKDLVLLYKDADEKPELLAGLDTRDILKINQLAKYEQRSYAKNPHGHHGDIVNFKPIEHEFEAHPVDIKNAVNRGEEPKQLIDTTGRDFVRAATRGDVNPLSRDFGIPHDQEVFEQQFDIPEFKKTGPDMHAAFKPEGEEIRKDEIVKNAEELVSEDETAKKKGRDRT